MNTSAKQWRRALLVAVLAVSLVIPAGCSSAPVYPYPKDGVEPCERACDYSYQRENPFRTLAVGLLCTALIVPAAVVIGVYMLVESFRPNPQQPDPGRTDGP